MQLPIFQIDAFTSRLFGGNPAAVMPLQAWLDDTLLQSIAAENNLSETAFIVPRAGGYELRWFTPTTEVPLCGHATLAAAHALFEHLGEAGEQVVFDTRSGELVVERSDAGLSLDFPAQVMVAGDIEPAVAAALGAQPQRVVQSQGPGDMVVYVYGSEAEVAALKPDFTALLAASKRCVIATAAGDQCDFVSRFFGPQVGLDEDPVTGSAHCHLVPYWARQLGRDTLSARQISARGGELACELRGDRVVMRGQGVTYMTGTVLVPVN